MTLSVTLERDYVHDCVYVQGAPGPKGEQGTSGADGPRVSVSSSCLSEQRTNCDPTCPLPVDRVIKGQKDRVESLDPRADRDLLEGVAHLGSWDREDPRYVESREVRLSGN